MSDLPTDAWLMALLSLEGMGPNRIKALIAEADPEHVWHCLVRGEPIPAIGVSQQLLGEWRSQARSHDVAVAWAAALALGGAIDPYGGDVYPARLLHDPEPPQLLFRLGAVLDDAPAVAIVGTRSCTAYGQRVAHELGRGLAEAGVRVVSGLALGIDAAAHRGALSVDAAPPIGVVGSGLDVVYPRRNASLWDAVAKRGSLVSETPFGVGPKAWRFPARNRIVAGLADALVVVESPSEGGSLISVDEAAGRDRPVGTVPGPITSPASAGSNGLLVDGAVPVLGVDDVLLMIGHVRPRETAVADDPTQRPVPEAVPVELVAVVEAIGWTPRPVDELCEQLGLSAAELVPRIEQLVASGACRRSGAFIERV